MTDFHPNLPRIFFSKVGNQQLRTAIWEGVDKGDGKRTPLLFFNGIGANLEIAQTFADTFTGRDIITFDMPGVGGSPDPKFVYRPWWVASAAKKILEQSQSSVEQVEQVGQVATTATAAARMQQLVLARDDFRDSALHLASANGEVDIVRLLLARGADVNAENNLGSTPLNRAAVAGRDEVSVGRVHGRRVGLDWPKDKYQYSSTGTAVGLFPRPAC